MRAERGSGARQRQTSTGGKRRRESVLRRLDAAAAWINPFLMAAATMLLILDMGCGVARIVARLPITHISAEPRSVQTLPPGTVSMAVQ